jgi:antitoxin FitA
MQMARTVQIRHVPDDVHRTLRVRAVAAGQSLSDYLLGEIVRVAERPAVADVLARAGSRSGSKATREQIVEAVRSGRDRT